MEKQAIDFNHYNEVAEHLFDRLDRMGMDDIRGLSIWQKPVGKFSGEVVLSIPRPSGGLYIVLADFTGRDLAAALGALSLAEVFYGMTKKGYGLSEIIEEMNKKLRSVLPKYFSCAVCFMELEQEGKMLTVWNGGIPDLMVLGSDGSIKHRVPSQHIHLGKREMQPTDLETSFVEVSGGDKIVFYSKGVLSARNTSETEFGQIRLETCLNQGFNFSEIQSEISNYMIGAEQVDDVTLAELEIVTTREYTDITSTELAPKMLPPAVWEADFEFSADVLRHLELAPLLVNILMDIQAPHEHRQRIYTVLAEMCSNALDHGLLELQSSLKDSANGFAEYYALRGQRLLDLTGGTINISLSHQPYKTGGQLTIRVEDSGKGFDFQQYERNLAENKTLSGRGISMLKQLCQDYDYSGVGNICQAIYHWSA